MQDSVMIRHNLLQVFASIDEEYIRLLRNAKEAEQLLEELEQSLSESQIDAIWSVISAYEEVDRYMTLLACKRMIFPSEYKKDSKVF